ncbi:LlaJI family restriction endonuclease [Candidatus Saccharibacteria bacterium]|nr:LlaJI family restriction endonuclease [Candidatus Saccharibacteria bacterium]
MKKTLNFFDARDSVDSFVGARIFETRIDFYFPLGIYFDPTNLELCRKKAFMILSVLSSASASNSLLDFSQDFLGSSKDPFNSFLWVLQDFDKNGLYNLKTKELIKGYKGKINWKRTFDSVPFVLDGDLIYLEPVAEKSSSVDTIITMIHKYCLALSIEKIGWIFGLENTETISELSESEKRYYEYVLLKELRKTFDDRRKILLSHLLRIVNGAIGDAQFADHSELGTYKFSRVWEYMIQRVYGNLPLDEFFPSATWHLLDQGSFKSSELRPDTVLELDGVLYILDAKYYKFGVSRSGADSLPASDSIQKQITYGDHAALKFSRRFSKGIRNAFVVPFCGSEGINIEYAGYATAAWRETDREDDMEYRKVHLLLLDTEYLIRKYQEKINNYENTKYLADKILKMDEVWTWA